MHQLGMPDGAATRSECAHRLALPRLRRRDVALRDEMPVYAGTADRQRRNIDRNGDAMSETPKPPPGYPTCGNYAALNAYFRP
jgi:hypothetical protein